MAQAEFQGYCLNCNSSLDEDAIYCKQCGQSIKETKLSFLQIAKDASSNILNLDSRLIHTIKDIYRPSKLTRTYVAGKRKFYVNPARLFIFSLLALISTGLFIGDFGIPSISQEITEQAANIKVSRTFDSLRLEIETKENKSVLDTIDAKVFDQLKGIDSDTIGKNLNFLSRKFSDHGITKYDAVHLTPDEVIEKYNITGLRSRLEVRQFLKISADTAGGVKYIIKNFSWVVLLQVFVMAIILKILYIRRNYYYVEHLVLLLYGHSFLFILSLIILLFEYLNIDIDIFIIVSLVLTIVIQFLSFLFYYKQKILKTIFKVLIFNGIYVFVFTVLSLFVSLISLALF